MECEYNVDKDIDTSQDNRIDRTQARKCLVDIDQGSLGAWTYYISQEYENSPFFAVESEITVL